MLQFLVMDLCSLLQNELNKYSDLDYCKTDLIQSKGIVFAKYAKASSALKGMEEINETGMVSPSILDMLFASKLCQWMQLILFFLPLHDPCLLFMYPYLFPEPKSVYDIFKVAGYKVKCMLAEPKSKRARLEGIMANTGYGIQVEICT